MNPTIKQALIEAVAGKSPQEIIAYLADKNFLNTTNTRAATIRKMYDSKKKSGLQSMEAMVQISEELGASERNVQDAIYKYRRVNF